MNHFGFTEVAHEFEFDDQSFKSVILSVMP